MTTEQDVWDAFEALKTSIAQDKESWTQLIVSKDCRIAELQVQVDELIAEASEKERVQRELAGNMFARAVYPLGKCLYGEDRVLSTKAAVGACQMAADYIRRADTEITELRKMLQVVKEAIGIGAWDDKDAVPLVTTLHEQARLVPSLKFELDQAKAEIKDLRSKLSDARATSA